MVFSQCCALSTFKSRGKVVTYLPRRHMGKVKIDLHSFLTSPYDCINPPPAPPKSIGSLGNQMEN
jgi:hypothetical protein